MHNTLGGIGIREEQIELSNIAAAFCREKSPINKVRELLEQDQSHAPETWDEMAELGWLAIAIPEEYGGVGLTLAEAVPVVEHMGRNLMSGPFISTTLAAQILLSGGTPAQKAEWLPKLAAGTKAALALMELDSRCDLTDLQTVAIRKGDDIVLKGQKVMVTDVDQADLLIVAARFEDRSALIVLPTNLLSESAIRRENVIDETRRSFEVTLDGMTVPSANMLAPDLAETAFQRFHLAANLLLAAEMCGGTFSCIEYTVEYLKTRKQFGKQIGAFQSLKHATVAAFCDYEKARSHLYSAAWSFETPGQDEIAVRMAKAQADKAFSFAADRAIQFHGGFGFTYECDAHLYRRRAIWCAAHFGDGAYHKAKLAELLLD